MTPQMWASRMLRNLRANHAEQEDYVRTLGAAERLRLVSLSSPGASTPLEQLDCKVQLAYCVSYLSPHISPRSPLYLHNPGAARLLRVAPQVGGEAGRGARP